MLASCSFFHDNDYMSFEFKPIQTETLAEYLKEIRLKLNLSSDEVAKKAGIPWKYIQAIENDDIKKLPASVYVLGFLKKIALTYGIPANILIEQYKKEQQIRTQLNSTTDDGTKYTIKNLLNWPSLTPGLIRIMVGTVLVMGTLIWLVWQILGINTRPSLEIYEPEDGKIISNSVIKVKGKTDPGASLTINSDPVNLDKDGNFELDLGVQLGQNELNFESINKFNKIAKKTIAVKIDLPLNPVMNTQELNLIEAKIITTKDLRISITLDGKILATENVKPGVPKVLRVNNELQILTPDAGNTSLIVGEKSTGVLGKVGETLDLSFSKDELNAIMKSN